MPRRRYTPQDFEKLLNKFSGFVEGISTSDNTSDRTAMGVGITEGTFTIDPVDLQSRTYQFYTTTSTGTSPEVAELRERVRVLEETLRALEPVVKGIVQRLNPAPPKNRARRSVIIDKEE